MKLSLLVMNFQNSKEVAMFDTIHLTNMLRSEVEGVPETGLPLDAFPDKIQEIILNLARYEISMWNILRLLFFLLLLLQ